MLTDMLRRQQRRPDELIEDTSAAAPSAAETRVPSRAFPKFLSALGPREHLTIIDVGPAVGSNLEFFGQRAACKIYIEDLFSEIEKHARNGAREKLATVLPPRIRQGDATVDAVLCWDIFDFLDKNTAQAFARELVRVMRPGAALFGLFANAAGQQSQYTKFVIADESHFIHRPMPATPVARQVLQNRDIIRLFDGLLVSDSFLLLTHTREIVFRKR
ncbi:MAG TPA: class I SAM-dependent methyltransferase [Vicinamibacterales bacterium]|nr:class I SAM-dependent methyltransferase [Vicinamibacterales bacterium]